MNMDIIFEEWKKAVDLIAYSADVSKPKGEVIELMVEQFIKNKGDLIPYFDDDLRLRIDISKDKEPFQKGDFSGILYEWKTTKVKSLYNKKYTKLRSYYKAISFIEELFYKLDYEEIINGRLNKEVYINNKRLNPGTKISKYIIALAENPDEYKLYRTYIYEEDKDLLIQFLLDLYSQINSNISNKKGVVVLSINPVDFILMSEHTSGEWTSCHSYLGGSYMTGGLSYALDDKSIIAFAYEKETLHKDGLNENLPLKLWRQMVYLDKDARCAVFGKHYPGMMPTFAKYARKLTGNLLSKYYDIEPVWEVTSGLMEQLPLLENEECSSTNKVPQICSNNRFIYVDNPVDAISMLEEGFFPLSIYVGAHNLYCINCGHIWEYEDGYTYTGKLVCDDCEPYVHCDSCDEWIQTDEIYELYNGDYLCPYCFEEYGAHCDNCGELFYKDDLYPISNDNYLCCNDCLDKYARYCEECNEYFLEHELEEIEIIDHGHIIFKEVCEDCIERYFDICSNCNKYYKDYIYNEGTELCTECYERYCEQREIEEEEVYLKEVVTYVYQWEY